jgi:hypothetical protein
MSGGLFRIHGLRFDYFGIRGKSQPRTGIWTMRGLVMALFALDFPGHDGSLKANHWAGRIGVPFQSSTNPDNTTAKTITKKTAKTV